MNPPAAKFVNGSAILEAYLYITRFLRQKFDGEEFLYVASVFWQSLAPVQTIKDHHHILEKRCVSEFISMKYYCKELFQTIYYPVFSVLFCFGTGGRGACDRYCSSAAFLLTQS